jgi:hypothetical protein
MVPSLRSGRVTQKPRLLFTKNFQSQVDGAPMSPKAQRSHPQSEPTIKHG